MLRETKKLRWLNDIKKTGSKNMHQALMEALDLVMSCILHNLHDSAPETLT
jgi:hypothetical protein